MDHTWSIQMVQISKTVIEPFGVIGIPSLLEITPPNELVDASLRQFMSNAANLKMSIDLWRFWLRLKAMELVESCRVVYHPSMEIERIDLPSGKKKQITVGAHFEVSYTMPNDSTKYTSYIDAT
jgi:hypothetical protein